MFQGCFQILRAITENKIKHDITEKQELLITESQMIMAQNTLHQKNYNNQSP